MSNSCVWKPSVRDPKTNEVKESVLFNQLLSFTGNNRPMAREYYGIAKHPTFIEEAKKLPTYEEDDYGEITFLSLRKALKIDLGQEKELSILNRGYTTESLLDAVQKVQIFNSQNPYRDKYLAVLTNVQSTNEKKEALVKIVPKTKSAEQMARKTFANLNLNYRIAAILARGGVSFSFSENNIYGLDLQQEFATGLYNLFKITEKDFEDGSDAFYENAAKAMVEVFKDNPLMQRLFNLIDKEDISQHLTQEQINGTIRDTYLTAAQIIKKELKENGLKKLSKNKKVDKFKYMLNRLFEHIKNVIKSFNLKEGVTKDTFKHQFNSAQVVARDLLYEIGSLENTETFTEEDLSTALVETTTYNVDLIKQALSEARKLGDALTNLMGSKYTAQYYKNIEYLESKITGRYNLVENYDALVGLAELSVSLLTDLEQNCLPTLENMDIFNSEDFNSNFQKQAKDLRAIKEKLKYAGTLHEILKKVTVEEGHSIILALDEYGNNTSYNFEKIIESFNNILYNDKTSMVAQCNHLERIFYIEFLKSVHGSEFVETAAHKAVKKWKVDDVVYKKEATVQFFTNLVANLESDISWFSLHVASMTNNPDIIGQMLNKAVRWASEWSDKEVFQVRAKINSLKEEFAKLGYTDGAYFCEVDEKGRYTGNFLTDKDYNKYESDFKEFKDELLDQFISEHPELHSSPYAFRKLSWEVYSAPKIREWRKKHAVYNTEKLRWEPSDYYKSKAYEEKIKGTRIEEKYKEFLSLKEHLDALLPPGSTTVYRMPQIEGRLMNRFRNNTNLDGDIKQSKFTILRRKFKELYSKTAREEDFGSDLTENEYKSNFFKSEESYRNDSIKKIPLFYINKLPNMQDISTDIFGTMTQYASMAYDYAALENIKDAIEIGNQVLLDRKVGEKTEGENISTNNAESSKAYRRIKNFTEQNLYNLNIKQNGPLARVIHRLGTAFSRLAGVMFLGGNVHGGAVNLGTGAIEIAKEAISGQFFSNKDFMKSHKLYFKYMLSECAEAITSTQSPNNWLGLFIQRFDILGKNREDLKNYKTEQSAISRLFFDSMYFPYSSGEHYMQTVPYLAMASNTKVWDKDGKEYSLLDIYKEINLEPSNTSSKYSSKIMVYTKDEKEAQILYEIKEILKYADKDITTVFGLPLKAEHIDYLKKNNLELLDRGVLETDINVQIIENAQFFTTPNFKEELTLLNGMIKSSDTNWNEQQKEYLKKHGYENYTLSELKTLLREEKENLLWNSKKEADFSLKAREVANRMHGVYNNIDKSVFHRNIYGNIFLAMKGWALGYIERRFGESKQSVALQTHTEGSFNTIFKILLDTYQNGFGSLLYLVLPPSKYVKGKMLLDGYSESQAANVRRFQMDMLFILGLKLLMSLTAKPEDWDYDEETNWRIFVGITHYFTSRLFYEQTTFSTFQGITTEGRLLLNPVPVGASAFISLLELVEHAAAVGSNELCKALFGNAIFEEGTEEYKKFYEVKSGKPRLNKKLKNMTPYYKSGKFIEEDPYKLLDNHEYGKMHL